MPNRSRQKAEVQQKTLVESIDRFRLYSELEPLILSALKYGSVDTLLSKSKSIATVEMIKLMATSEKEDVRFKAAQEILNRSMGKPVERKISLYSDLESMNEADIDRQIKTLMKELGPGEVVDAIASVGVNKKKAIEDGEGRESASEDGVTSSPEGEGTS